jgi:hypothetical protein
MTLYDQAKHDMPSRANAVLTLDLERPQLIGLAIMLHSA